MIQNDFAEWLVKVMLSWSRWLSNIFWGAINSGGGESAGLSWFGRSWPSMVVVLIVAGIAVDWLVWMVRWRPYWLWFRKKQVIYEEADEAPARSEPRFEPRVRRDIAERSEFADPLAEPVRDEFDDPFADPTPREALPRKHVFSIGRASEPDEELENALVEPERPRQKKTRASGADEGFENAFVEPERPRQKKTRASGADEGLEDAFVEPERPRQKKMRSSEVSMDVFSDPLSPESAPGIEKKKKKRAAGGDFDDPLFEPTPERESTSEANLWDDGGKRKPRKKKGDEEWF